MRRKFDSTTYERIAADGAVGAGLGAMIVVTMLSFDSFGLGALVQQTRFKALHVGMMLFKPMMLLGVAAGAWSLWRQVAAEPSVETERLALMGRRTQTSEEARTISTRG